MRAVRFGSTVTAHYHADVLVLSPPSRWHPPGTGPSGEELERQARNAHPRRMKCGWGCGAEHTGRNMRPHFAICPSGRQAPAMRTAEGGLEPKRGRAPGGECCSVGAVVRDSRLAACGRISPSAGDAVRLARGIRERPTLQASPFKQRSAPRDTAGAGPHPPGPGSRWRRAVRRWARKSCRCAAPLRRSWEI
jgi:hypothetical protein